MVTLEQRWQRLGWWTDIGGTLSYKWCFARGSPQAWPVDSFLWPITAGPISLFADEFNVHILEVYHLTIALTHMVGTNKKSVPEMEMKPCFRFPPIWNTQVPSRLGLPNWTSFFFGWAVKKDGVAKSDSKTSIIGGIRSHYHRQKKNRPGWWFWNYIIILSNIYILCSI